MTWKHGRGSHTWNTHGDKAFARKTLLLFWQSLLKIAFFLVLNTFYAQNFPGHHLDLWFTLYVFYFLFYVYVCGPEWMYVDLMNMGFTETRGIGFHALLEVWVVLKNTVVFEVWLNMSDCLKHVTKTRGVIHGWTQIFFAYLLILELWKVGQLRWSGLLGWDGEEYDLALLLVIALYVSWAP